MQPAAPHYPWGGPLLRGRGTWAAHPTGITVKTHTRSAPVGD
jgi:hypothetical protein